MIDKEGIGSLSPEELVVACIMRGIRTTDVGEDQMKLELQQWLDLNLHHEIPPLLLVMTRALILAHRNNKKECDSMSPSTSPNPTSNN
jgi:LETM1 and EF-hand domain-containing protein 1, mitochondrial